MIKYKKLWMFILLIIFFNPICLIQAKEAGEELKLSDYKNIGQPIFVRGGSPNPVSVKVPQVIKPLEQSDQQEDNWDKQFNSALSNLSKYTPPTNDFNSHKVNFILKTTTEIVKILLMISLIFYIISLIFRKK